MTETLPDAHRGFKPPVGCTVLSLWRGWIKARPLAAPIIAEIAEHYGLTVEDLKGPSHARHISWPRQHAMAEIHARTGQTLRQIGNALGGRDHSTIRHGIRAHERRMGRQG